MLFHGVVTGKSCSAVSISENFRDIYGRQGKKGEEDKSIEGYFIRQWAGCSLSNMISQKGPITPEMWIYTLPFVSPNTIFPIDEYGNDYQNKYSQKKLKDIIWSPENSHSESIDEIHIKAYKDIS